jgi:hypothetical protein
LTIPGRVDSKRTLAANREILNWDQIYARGLGAENGEEVDLTVIVATE